MPYPEAYRRRAEEVEEAEFLTQATSGLLVIKDDIDQYGKHLHHTGPLKLFEAERFRVFENHGMPLEELAAEVGLGFVWEITVKYPNQVFEGETVLINSRVFKTRPTMLSFHQVMTRDSVPVVTAVVDGILVGNNKRAIKIPQEVIDNLKRKTS